MCVYLDGVVGVRAEPLQHHDALLEHRPALPPTAPTAVSHRLVLNGEDLQQQQVCEEPGGEGNRVCACIVRVPVLNKTGKRNISNIVTSTFNREPCSRDTKELFHIVQLCGIKLCFFSSSKKRTQIAQRPFRCLNHRTLRNFSFAFRPDGRRREERRIIFRLITCPDPR